MTGGRNTGNASEKLTWDDGDYTDFIIYRYLR
jgi:hypothetical protein